MIKTANFLQNELIDLSKEISLIAPTDTPFATLLMQKKLVDTATSPIVSWRTKQLDNTADITVSEGSKTDTFQASTRVELNNVCQIFKKATQISGTAIATNVEGIADLYASEVNDRLIELKVALEKALINSTKDDGSTSGIRKMQGLLAWVPDVNKVNGTLSIESFKSTIRKLWENGVTGDIYCMCNADIKEEIDALFENQYRYIANNTDFGFVVRTIQTNYGNVNLVLNRHMPVDKAIFFDANYLRLSYLRKPFSELLSKDGDYISGHVITEATLKVLNPLALAMLTVA